MPKVIHRKHVEPMEPAMAVARIRGLSNLYAEGKSAEQLWIYAATGNIWNPQQVDGLSAVMRGDLIDAVEDIRETLGQKPTRDQVKAECVRRLRAVLMAGGQ